MFSRSFHRLALGAALALVCVSAFAQSLTTIHIQDLPAAGLFTGTELFPLEQGMHTVAGSTSQIETLMAQDAHTWTAAQIFGASTTFNAASSFSSSVVIGSATGGSCGAGCLNVAALRVNGAVLAPGITSLALSGPIGTSTAGSPCGAGSCTQTMSWSSESASSTLIAPSGGAGAPTWRKITAPDLAGLDLTSNVNVLTAGQGGSGVAGTLAGPLEGNGTGAYSVATGSQLAGQFTGAASTCWLLGNGTCSTVVANAIASTGSTYGGSTGAVTQALGSSGGSGNSFRMWHGFNAWWNGTNWVTGTDGTSSGGSLITAGNGTTALSIYNIPSTGGASQAISNATLPTFDVADFASTGVAIHQPQGSNTALTVSGVAGSPVLNVMSASGGSGAGDLVVSRAGSGSNTLVGGGPNITLSDTSASTQSLIQHASGATSIWQFNSSWHQMAFWDTNRSLTLNAPASGNTLTVTGTGNFTTGLQINGVPFTQVPLPKTATSAPLTVSSANCGGFIEVSANTTISIPASSLPIGCAFVIDVSNPFAATITASSGTLFWANGSVGTGNRTVTGEAIVTILVTDSGAAKITGSGIS